MMGEKGEFKIFTELLKRDIRNQEWYEYLMGQAYNENGNIMVLAYEDGTHKVKKVLRICFDYHMRNLFRNKGMDITQHELHELYEHFKLYVIGKSFRELRGR